MVETKRLRKLYRGWSMLKIANALLIVLAVGWSMSLAAAAQTKPSTPAKKAPAARKAPVRKAPVRRARVRRPRVQTAPARDRIKEIQEALAREGFYDHTPSGKWDAATIQAMRNFQVSKGLTPTGKLGAQSLQKLGLGSEIAGMAAPLARADAAPSALSESDLNDPGPDPDEPSGN